ncbi:hypothetical protein Poli38472_000478 [Pythium oligandrum]|uniref:Uncharacterized protein n=1 Tax=Pythium oligandrum TaxID=41045 RepID=A0A8K1FFD5_PYTOL|nr:hypothetical protein Poli38472_000478 [Pythium oligandrum]|eukprot:TMW60436.1 hypothetical protein Poli38472_000478 [Pythium oligandrum]
MPFSIEAYKRRVNARSAKSRKAKASTLPDENFEGFQKKYLDFCVEKTLDPDHALLKALRTSSFVLTLDGLSGEELASHLAFLQRCSELSQLMLSLGSLAVDRELRKKFDRLGLKKAPAFAKESTAKIIKAVCVACEQSPRLIRLQLKGILITEKQAQHLARTLVKCTQLESINWANSRLGDQGLAEVSVVVGKLPRLVYLNLSVCRLTEKARDHLAKIITLHGALQDESAWSSSLRSQSSVVIVDKPPSLVLDLSHNALGDATVQTLCDALYHDKWTLAIRLCHNRLTCNSYALLHKTLQQSNSTLAVIKVAEEEESNAMKAATHDLSGLAARRIGVLQRFAAESNERRLFLCHLFLEWQVERELVLRICGETGSEVDAPSVGAVSTDSKRSSHQKPKVNAWEEETQNRRSPHPEAVTFLVGRLAVLEQDHRKTLDYVTRLEQENQQLRDELRAVRESQSSVIAPAEEQIIAQLEDAIAHLANQVELLTLEKQSRGVKPALGS